MTVTALKGADRALDRERARRLLRETSAASGWRVLDVRDLEVVKVRPGRRLIVRYETLAARPGEPPRHWTLYGKLYHGHGGARVHAALSYLRRVPHPALQFPELLGYHPRRRFLLLGAVEGTPLDRGLDGEDALSHLARLARGVGALHTLPAPDPAVAALRIHDAAAEAGVLEQARARIEAANWEPELRASFVELQRRVCDLLQAGAPAGSSPAMIHRDLYPAQVLLQDGRVALIDLDDLALGEPELDLGNCGAHLVLRGLQAGVGPDRGRGLQHGFLEACGRVRPLAAERCAVYTAASYLRLASLERLAVPGEGPGWPVLSRALLAEAGRWVAGV